MDIFFLRRDVFEENEVFSLHPDGVSGILTRNLNYERYYAQWLPHQVILQALPQWPNLWPSIKQNPS